MSNVTECRHPTSELLPWYINGSLRDDERSSVDEHIQDCEQCKADCELLHELNTSVNDETIAPIVPQPDVERLFAKIDGTSNTVHANATMLRRSLVAGLIAASFIVAAIVWRGQEVDNLPARFETATASSSATSFDYVLRIRFEDTTSDLTRDAVLSLLETKDVRKELEDYRVVVNVPGTTLQALEKYTQDIQSMPEVSLVEVVAIQIPTSKEK